MKDFVLVYIAISMTIFFKFIILTLEDILNELKKNNNL
jgi:hypothetical protein